MHYAGRPLGPDVEQPPTRAPPTPFTPQEVGAARAETPAVPRAGIERAALERSVYRESMLVKAGAAVPRGRKVRSARPFGEAVPLRKVPQERRGL